MTYYVINPDSDHPRFECAKCFEIHSDAITAPVDRVEHNVDHITDASTCCDSCWSVDLDSFDIDSASRVVTRRYSYLFDDDDEGNESSDD